jgi:hypothetical protein
MHTVGTPPGTYCMVSQTNSPQSPTSAPASVSGTSLAWVKPMESKPGLLGQGRRARMISTSALKERSRAPQARRDTCNLAGQP